MSSPATALPETVPVRECWATVDGHQVRYLCAGSGPPLLLIHGLLGYSFSWRLNIAELSRHATVYAVDLLGIGLSDHPVDLDCSLRSSAARLLQFMDAVGLASADVLGTSHGGALALMMAVLGADTARVRRLILAAPVNPWSGHGQLMIRFFASAPGAALFRRFAPHLRSLHGYFLGRMYGDRRRVPPGTVDGYSATLAIPGTAEYLLKIVQCWNRDVAQLESLLPRIRAIPTLLIWGTRDPMVWPSSAEPLRARFQNCRLQVIAGAGHLPYEECPREFNEIVTEFLAGDGPDPRIAGSGELV